MKKKRKDDPNKAAIMAKLKELGATNVDIEWSGGGDSGQIDLVNATDKNGKSIKIEDAMINITAKGSALNLRTNNGDFINDQDVTIEEQVSLDQAIERLVEDWWESSGQGGWWNNDGGNGSGAIDVEKGTIRLEHYNNMTTSELGASEIL